MRLFPPRDRPALHDEALAEILEERVASSRGRQVPRGVKRKMSGYPLRPRTPQPTTRIDFSAAIRIAKRTALRLTGHPCTNAAPQDTVHAYAGCFRSKQVFNQPRFELPNPHPQAAAPPSGKVDGARRLEVRLEQRFHPSAEVGA